MAITIPQLGQMVSTTLENHMSGQAFEQAVQEKPLLKILRSNQKTFGGGNTNDAGDTTVAGGKFSVPVKFAHSSTDGSFKIQGYTGADTVSYGNPNNTTRARYGWKELHMGLGVTLTELKRAGIHIQDSTSGLEGNVTRSSDRDAYVLADILDDKLSDFTEKWVEDFNKMLWFTGAADPKAIAGLSSLIAPPTGTLVAGDPLSGTYTAAGGIDPATAAYAAWKHRSDLAIATNVADGGALLQYLHGEFRQLRRYGGKPDIALCGSDFLEALEKEMRANGYYSDSGFAGSNDFAMGAIKHKGINFVYDPTLDDVGAGGANTLGAGAATTTGSKMCYILDSKRLRLRPMDGEDMKRHTPARPENQYLAYSAITFTGAMDMTQRNCHGVYGIA